MIDFLFIDRQHRTAPEEQAILVYSVLLTPGDINRLYQARGENIQKYEKGFGMILLPPDLR